MTHKTTHPIPRHTYTIGMWLFLVSLTMLFGASMVGYYLIRLGIFGGAATHPELGAVHLPATLWISTAIIIAASFSIHRALLAARRERQTVLHKNLLITSVLAMLFVLVQCPSLLEVLKRQHSLGMPLYGLIFFLILLHALHVFGGIVSLLIVTVNSLNGRYDHEHHNPVRHVALYWHFLDCVWLVMFLSMWFLR